MTRNRISLALIALAAAGCSEAAAGPGDEPKALMSGAIVQLEGDTGYSALVKGKSCDLFADYARIEDEKEVIWIPRERIKDLRLRPK